MFKQNFPIYTLTSYKIGGPARYFFEAKNPDELKAALKEAKKRNLEFFVLGGGTNLLIDDEGFRGLVLKPSINFIKLSGEEVSVGAGVLVADLINFLIENGLSGLEWAGGLPGTVGGAIRGNAGAFGGEIKDAVKSVKSLNVETLDETRRAFPDCSFSYRSSVFKNSPKKEIILSAIFALKKDSPGKIEKSVNEKILYRQQRHPLEYPNAGSIFKNVDAEKISKKYIKQFSHVIKTDPFPVVPAAYIISETGLKGIALGGAMISPKHPNFIVNVLEAKSSDIKDLINLVKGEVNNKFGIELEEEIIAV